MNLVDRVKGILVSPKTEWPKIAAEPMTAQQIYTGYVMILGAIGPLAMIIGWSNLGLGSSVRFALAHYVILLVVTAILAFIIDAVAPKFGGTKDFVAVFFQIYPSLKSPAYAVVVGERNYNTEARIKAMEQHYT